MLMAHEARALAMREIERHDTEQLRSLVAEIEALIRAAIARRAFWIRIDTPDDQRFNRIDLCKYLRDECGYKIEQGTTRKPHFTVSFGGAMEPGMTEPIKELSWILNPSK